MTRFNGLLAAAFAMAVVGGVWAEDKKEPAKFDASKLEGKWMATEYVKGGEKQDTKNLKEPAVFTKDSIKVKSGDGMAFEFKYTLDTKADPVAVDMEITAPEGLKGAKAKGIIKMDGDKLWLTYDPSPDGKRPEKFESKKDTMVHSITMTRAKEEKKEEKK